VQLSFQTPILHQFINNKLCLAINAATHREIIFGC
jgi:hypothetical protein